MADETGPFSFSTLKAEFRVNSGQVFR